MGVDFWVVKNKESGCLFVFVFWIISLYYDYGRKHLPCEALNATPPASQLLTEVKGLASASCSCIVTATVTITTPNIASADTMAITANVLLLDISKS